MCLIGHCSGFPSRIRLHGGQKLSQVQCLFTQGSNQSEGMLNFRNTPPPHTTFQCQIRGRLCPTFSLTSWNRQSNIHTHFTLWLGSCAKLRQEPAFELLSECNTEWLPGETVWKYLPFHISPYLNNIMSSPSMPPFLSAFQCGHWKLL